MGSPAASRAAQRPGNCPPAPSSPSPPPGAAARAPTPRARRRSTFCWGEEGGCGWVGARGGGRVGRQRQMGGACRPLLLTQSPTLTPSPPWGTCLHTLKPRDPTPHLLNASASRVADMTMSRKSSPRRAATPLSRPSSTSVDTVRSWASSTMTTWGVWAGECGVQGLASGGCRAEHTRAPLDATAGPSQVPQVALHPLAPPPLLSAQTPPPHPLPSPASKAAPGTFSAAGRLGTPAAACRRSCT
jgi:hypothetical protein